MNRIVLLAVVGVGFVLRIEAQRCVVCSLGITDAAYLVTPGCGFRGKNGTAPEIEMIATNETLGKRTAA